MPEQSRAGDLSPVPPGGSGPEWEEHDRAFDEPLWSDSESAKARSDRAQTDPEVRRALRAHSPRRAQRRSARLDRPAMTLPITALIDVVFLLLVFFLLVTDFSGPEEVFRIDLPPTAVAPSPAARDGADRAPQTPRDPFALERQPIRVLVTSTGPGEEEYQLEVVGLEEPVQGFAALEAALRRHLVDPSTRQGLYLPDQPVVLEPSPATTWGHSVGAFNAAVRAGYTNVVFRGL
jgi:biopolymer transport protein ExbD